VLGPVQALKTMGKGFALPRIADLPDAG